MFKRYLNFFFSGLLITVPTVLIIYLFYISFVRFDEFLREAILPEGKKIWGLGLLVFVVIISLIGFLSTTFLYKPIAAWFNKMMNRIPLIKTIYSAVTDLLSAFVGKKKRFDKPVLVKMDIHSGLEKIGFITDEDLDFLNNPDGKVGVYLPYSYGIMGSFYIVPVANITLIDRSASELMKYIVSGGISETEEKTDPNTSA